MHSNRLIGLSDADSAKLAEIVAEVEKTQAVIAAAQAAQTRALARAGHLARTQSARSRASVREHDMVLRSIAAEVAGVLRLTDRSVQRQIGDATELVEDYPATLQTWEAGEITRAHVRVITETGTHLPPDQRGAFELDALRRCAVETPGRVRRELELLAEHLHPRTLAERHADAAEQRTVRIVPIGDGMSDLCATLPSLLADAIYDRLTRQARGITDARTRAAADARKRIAAADGIDDGDETPVDEETLRLQLIASDTRTTNQLRTDLLADMLLTSAPGADPTRTDDGPGRLGAIRAKVQIVVPVLTLLGSDTAPADLVGHSPIDPATARELAAATRSPWERVLTHPITGTVLHVDTYQRTTAIDRYLRARDQHCRFPGCRLPAIRCEVDHTIDAALGGPTDVRNLAHFCQRHHSMKQFTPWKVEQLPDGVLRWTSPLGRDYLEHPPSLGVHFRPDDGPLAPF
ncbi:DUF222 domain-containing protein [Microbacterium sp. NPDC055910]|uniref:HNH endonuclease signature motif containing protein n=1 Tax=Microbacterium sp. NPDC055910 TaxID=3345659 RepID=UPI0035DBD3F5